MRLIDIEARKKLQLLILLDVHRFCEENNITYYLSSGSLLGAVRHQGYIPWDDDIDIAMPRPDYDRFFSTYSSQYYEAKNIDVDSSWCYIMGKVCDIRTNLQENISNDKYFNLGVHIDVFPLDGLPDNFLARKIYLGKIFLWTKIIGYKVILPLSNERNLLKKILHSIFYIILSNISLRFLLQQKNTLIRKYSWQNSLMVSSLATSTERIPIDKALFENKALLPFEGYLLYAPSGYDKWLKIVYGDYLQLPPKEKRCVPHNYVAYWLD